MRTYVLGLDLGGTKVYGALFDKKGQIVGKARAKTQAWRDDEQVFHTIVHVGRLAMERAGITDGELAAVGIGSPGPLDPVAGTIIESANLGFVNFPLGPRLSEEFQCPVVVDNDVNVGTYGEFRAGAARGARQVLGMFIGTGIGGGLILNGALYHGFSKNAGEVGHIIIQSDGPKCGCGRRGCLEALSSRVAMTREIRRAIKRGKKTVLARTLTKDRELIQSKELKRAFDAGDEVARKVVTSAAHHIGEAIGSLANVFGPEIVVLGGGVIEAFGDEIIVLIDRSARRIGFDFVMKDLKIVKAELGDDAGVIGVSTLAREYLKRHQARKRKQ